MSSNTTTSLAVQAAETDAGLEGKPQLENAQVHGGVTRVTVSGGVEETTHQGTTRITADDLRGDFKGDILSTARTRAGFPARELTPETIVNVGGLEMTLQDAESARLIRRDDQGRYQEVSASEQRQAQQQQQQQKQEQPEDGPQAFAPEVEQELARLTKDVPGEVLGATAVSVALDILDGKEINAEAIASRTGMAPEAAHGALLLAHANFQAQVDKFVDKAGANPEQFYDWARTSNPEQLRKAVSQLLSTRTTAGFAPLVDQFMWNTTPTPETLKQAGYETRIDPTTKEPMVKLDGMWVSARVAARLKRI